MLAENKFSSDKEVIAKTEAFFEAKDKYYYKNGIEKLKDRYTLCTVCWIKKKENYKKMWFTIIGQTIISPPVSSTHF